MVCLIGVLSVRWNKTSRLLEDSSVSIRSYDTTMCLTINLQCSEKSSSGKGFKRIAKKGHTAVNTVYFISSRITYRAIPIPCNANVRWFTSRINFCFLSHTWLHPWIYSELACVASVPVRTNFSALWPRGREQKIGGRGWEWGTPQSADFLLSPQFSRGQNAEKFVRTRTLATQANSKLNIVLLTCNW